MPAGTAGEPDTRPTSPSKPGSAAPRFRLEAAKAERAWAVVSAHRDGLSVRKTAEAAGLSPTRVHQLLTSPDAANWEFRLDVLRTLGWPAPEDPPADAPSGDTVAERLADEAQALRDVTEWLDKLVRTGMPELLELRPRSDHPLHHRVLASHERIVAILEGSLPTSTSWPGRDASPICPPRPTTPTSAYAFGGAWPSRRSRCPDTARRTSSGVKRSSGSSTSTAGQGSQRRGVGDDRGTHHDRPAN